MKRIVILLAWVLLGLIASACSTVSANTPAQLPAGNKVKVSGGSYTNVDAKTLKGMLDHKNFTFVNVHIPYIGEIANTDALIPYTEIEQKLSQLPADKNAMIVLYCSSGHMSTTAAQKLVALGYTNVWNLDGGMSGWSNQGFQLVQK